jgi:hypothetical protein
MDMPREMAKKSMASILFERMFFFLNRRTIPRNIPWDMATIIIMVIISDTTVHPIATSVPRGAGIYAHCMSGHTESRFRIMG